MQCTTEKTKAESELAQLESGMIAGRWEEIERQLPAQWEALAYSSGAIKRRRGVRNAAGLLQLILAYAVGDWSLRMVGLWGTVSGVAGISDVAVLNRLRQSQDWLEQLVGCVLRERVGGDALPAVQLCLVDATSLSRPGSHGTDWRVHLNLNLGETQVESLTLTDAKGGEGLHHFRFAPGQIVLADRAYGHAKSLAQLLAHQATCVVRIRWNDLSLYKYQGQPFQVCEWLKTTFADACCGAQAVELQLTTQGQTFPLRLVASPLPPIQAEKARRRVRRKAQKNQVQVMPETLLVAGFVLLVTNLPAAHWSPAQIAQLYRLRWQVELYFKRLKSILHLDRLRARDPKLARVYLLAKLLAALLLDRLSHIFLAHLPWQNDLHRPLSRWRLTALFWSNLLYLLNLPFFRLLSWQHPAPLRRYLCNSPRKRLQQDVFARLFVRSLSVVNVLVP
jgi:hypothetical protein